MTARMDYKNVTCVLTDASVLSRAAALVPFSVAPSSQYVIFPGFCDVHVHFREPGFSYKETMLSGSAAAARGGYTDVCTMPNLNPVPDSVAHLGEQLALIPEGGIRIHPYGAITVGQRGEALADLQGMAPDCIAFSDDGRGVQSESLMRQAMLEAKRLGKMIVAATSTTANTPPPTDTAASAPRASGDPSPATSNWSKRRGAPITCATSPAKRVWS